MRKKNLAGMVAFITGGTRGGGGGIARMLGGNGVNVVSFARTDKAHRALTGSRKKVVEEITELGGQALYVAGDVCSVTDTQNAVQIAVDTFGGIDFVINCASALYPLGTENTTSEHLRVMWETIVAGTLNTTRACLSHLIQSGNGHILNICPPLERMTPKEMSRAPAYSSAKGAVSMLTMAWTEEFAKHNIKVNGLWPAKFLFTAPVVNMYKKVGGTMMEAVLEARKHSRSPKIMADAGEKIFTDLRDYENGLILLDEEWLWKPLSRTDFDEYLLDGVPEIDIFGQ